MSTKGEGVKKVRKTVHMVCVWPLVYWRAIYRGGCVFYDRQFFPYGLGTNGFFSSSNFMQIKARAWHLWQSWKNFFLFFYISTHFSIIKINEKIAFIQYKQSHKCIYCLIFPF